ncbi:SH3 domain-containing protein [Anaerosalibacter massiliensis]|uniref:SH3 domain-containing protein n=1 Tax=Anaerosalibacter massiliensis TaxID=1347392 RepID=A0A9X2MM63_9FIRM|nr:SH3 domain-containing protein [Anaerosalibacter massiliensis]MCR2045595.1 SH3 domain-containing protein [Anaerosalibacter massiliensis]
MKRKLSLIVLLIVMIMVPTVIVEASDGLDNLDIISIEINKKELVEGDTFNLQANISGDTSQVDELVFKYKLKNTNDTKELKLGYNNEKKLWELNLQINKDWKDGVWELYEVDYSLIQDTNYQTLECHECYADANFTVVRSTDSSIDIEKKQAEKDQVEKSQVEKSQNVELTASTINGSYVEKVDWTVDKKSPQDLGSSIKITANAEGGKDVVYLFQIKKDGVWKTLRSYSEDNTYTWTPDEPGEYLFSVIARDKHTWEKSAFMNKRYTINGNYVKEVDWTADKQSPQDLGSSIKITANSKGSDNAVYLFQIKKDGVWKTLRGYSEDNTYIWTPDEPGEYLFSVIARDKYTWDEFVFMNKRYTINGNYVEKVDWTVDKKSPQDLGSSIKITANAEGGKDVVYLFQIKKDGVWKTLRSYSEDNTYTWTPDEPGEYLFSVIARDKHTWEKSAFMNKRYTINGNYVKEVDWTADKQSPQDLGSSIKITANSKGSDNAVYLFQIKKDGVWKTLRGYSEDNTYIWTPDEPGEYLFSVIARDKYTWDEFVFMNKRYTINTINTIGGKNSYYITYYDKSFEEALKIQMSRNPQTDLYGGGWKTAKQEDVAYYLNPKNFLQFTPVEGTSQNDIVKVTASTLNVRSQPTVNSNILTQVFNGSTYKVLGESNGWYKIEANNKIGWISGQYVIATSDIQYLNTIQVTATVLNVREKPTTNSSIVSQVKAGSAYIVLDKSNGWYKINANGKIGWVYGEYVNSVNDFPREMYQFLVLSGTSGISINDLNNALRGKGILEGKGQAFIEAGKQHNVNELYLLSHAFLETGNGTSKLATGILVDKVDGKAVTPRVVYNMFGIGAADKDPLRLGAEYAYKEGWFTPEAAIIGGAKFISKSYINNPNYQQDTLYKMRWNPISPGSHQYATDIGWALKQTRNIDIMMEICAQSSSVTLRFDIPKYR